MPSAKLDKNVTIAACIANKKKHLSFQKISHSFANYSCASQVRCIENTSQNENFELNKILKIEHPMLSSIIF